MCWKVMFWFALLIDFFLYSIFTFLYIKQCTIWNCIRWMKIISRKKIDKHWNISLGKITYLSLLSAIELIPLLDMSYVLTARQSMHFHKCRDGNGVTSSLHTYILRMTLLLKVLQGKAGRGSKVDIYPALTCCFSVSKWLMGYLLPVWQDVFSSSSQILFFAKNYFMCIGWVPWTQLFSV